MPALWLLILVTLMAAPQLEGGPTLATEDTLHTEVPEVLVRAPRVTLDEILDRVARGEARRDSLMNDQVFTAALRVLHHPHGAREPQLYEETVWRVYKRRPDRVRAVLMRETYGPAAKRDDHSVSADFTPRMSEDVVTFAFQPSARREYRYRILERRLLGDHVVYRIAFEPRSALDVFRPHGEVWVDTNDFVIVRQEVGFERSPIPLLVRSLDRMVVERRRVDDLWVLSRVLMRARLTVPLPRIGSAIEFAMVFDDYAINQGVPDSVFAGTKGR